MNNQGFFGPSPRRTPDSKPRSDRRDAPANASDRVLGRFPNRFASFNPGTSKTPALMQKQFSFNRPKSTSFLASAGLHRHSSRNSLGSTFLMPVRVQSAPRLAFSDANFDRESSAEEQEKEEESYASHYSNSEGNAAEKHTNEGRKPSQTYQSSSDDHEPEFSNRNCTRSHSSDLNSFGERDDTLSKENSANAKQSHDSMDGVLHVANMLEKYGASLRSNFAQRAREQEKYREAIRKHISTIKLLERERDVLKDELHMSVRTFDAKRSEQDANLQNLREEHKIALDDVSSLTKQYCALRSKSQSETKSFKAILREKEHEANERSTLFKKTLEELSYLQSKLQDEAELKLGAKKEASNILKQLHVEAELKVAAEQKSSVVHEKLLKAQQAKCNIEKKLDEALNELRISTQENSKERIVLKQQISDMEEQLRHTQGELKEERKRRQNMNSKSQQALVKLKVTRERAAVLENDLESARIYKEALLNENMELQAKVKSITQLLEQNAVQLKNARDTQEQQMAQQKGTKELYNHELAQKKKAIKHLEQLLERERDQREEVRQSQSRELARKNEEIRLCKESYQRLKIERDELEQARERQNQALTEKTLKIRSLGERFRLEADDRLKNLDILSSQLHAEKKNCADALGQIEKLCEERNKRKAEFAEVQIELTSVLSREQAAMRKIQFQNVTHQTRIDQIATSATRDNAAIRKHIECIGESGRKSSREIAEARTLLHTCHRALVSISNLPRTKNEHLTDALEDVHSRLKNLLIDYATTRRELTISKEEIEGATRVAHEAVMERDSLKRSLEVAETRLAGVEPAGVGAYQERAVRGAEGQRSKHFSRLSTPGVFPSGLQRRRAQPNRRHEAKAVQATGKPLVEACTIPHTRPRRKKAHMKLKADASVLQANDETLFEKRAGPEASQSFKYTQQSKSDRPSSSRGNRKKRRILDTGNVGGTNVTSRNKLTVGADAPFGNISHENADDEEDADIFNFEGQLALQK